MSFMKKITKLSKKLGKSAEKTYEAVKDKSEKIIKEAEIKDKVSNLSKKVGELAGKTYDAAKDKTIDIIKDTKTMINVSDSKKEIDKIYEQIGIDVYDNYRKGRKIGDGITKRCKEIDRINKEILRMKDKPKTIETKDTI